MKKSNSTKRALVMSVLALILCATMLIGSTYAWFTDNVTSTGNVIKAGKLDVTMSYADGNQNPDTVAWKDAADTAIFSYSKWEPGYVDAKHIKIANAGNLALKYQISIEATGVVGELAEVIDVYYADPAVQVSSRTNVADMKYLGTLNKVLANINTTASGKLAEGKSDIVTIVLKMQESAGNEYQEKSIGDSFAVKLLATQDTVEADTFGTDYDTNASYPVTSASELESAIENGGVIELSNDVELTSDVTYIKNNATINLGDNTISTYREDTSIAGGYSISALSVIDTDVVINATTGGVENPAFGYAITLNKGNLIINGGNYSAGGSQAIYVYEGTLTINDGFYDRTCYDYGPQYLINCLDANYKNGTANVIITGGTFVDWDPSNNASEGEGTDFVPEGYTVVSETKTDGEVWYTVVAE